MYLRRLALQNFRNIAHADFHPDPGFNVLWGDNAQGKTNVIEGLYLLGTLRSFRHARNEDLVRDGGSESRLTGEVLTRGVNRRLDLTVSPQRKLVRVDGKEARTPAEFFGCLQPVLFSPEEIMLVKGPPAGRRSLVDRALFQADVTFLARAREFDRCLRQRNRLLRDQAAERELEPWTEGLIVTGARLRLDRLRYLERISPLLQEAFRQISGGEETQIEYLPSRVDLPQLKLVLAQELAAAAERERRLGQTLAGPHRDELIFSINSKPLRIFGSQGQQRSFLLAFKTAQVRDLENQTGEPPPLLLDDLTSELDPRRRDFFFRFLLERQGQVFITTTDIDSLLDRGLTQARFFRVEQGALHPDSRERG